MTNEISHTSEIIINERNTALAMGSGDLPVLATPALVALMENAAMLAASSLCTHEETSVGASIDIKHLLPSALGATVQATATLINKDGRKLIFDITATQNSTTVGTATHVRYIVNRNKFMSKIQPQ